MLLTEHTSWVDLKEFWDYEKNKLIPEEMTYGSSFNVWWKCSNGHNFEKKICLAVSLLNGVCTPCNRAPYTHMYLLKELDHSKLPTNFNIDDIGWSDYLYWLCERGHSYKSRFSKRAIGRGCSYCSNRDVLTGFNDFQTLFPNYLESFDTENNKCSAKEIIGNYNRKYHWICELGHTWFSSILSRDISGGDCPYCKEVIAVSGINDLKTLLPELHQEIFATKKTVDKEKFTIKSNSTVTWKCKVCSNIWVATVSARVRGSGCTACSGFKFSKGVNDLYTRYPHLVKYYSNQNESAPSEMETHSSKEVIWNCGNHTYKSTIANRIKGRGCSYCTHRVFKEGVNDFKTIHPKIAKEYSVENPLSASKFWSSSQEVVKWSCKKCSGIWETSIVSRTMSSYQGFCNTCTVFNKSAGEIKVFEFVKSFLSETVSSGDRKAIAPYELDVYIPSLKKAIEFNGDYWHSEEVIQKKRGTSAKEYHDMKFNRCEAVGIELLYIWESELNNNEAACKEKIKDFISRPYGWYYF